MITKELIEERINTFWGYGNLKSDIWFVGMEEGFNGSLNDLEDRFQRTHGKKVIDIQDDMIGVDDHTKWFSPNSNIQQTWGKLILVLLFQRNGDIVSKETIKQYQRNNFGRLTSDHCILELLPLPSRSTNKKDWMYEQFHIEYLKDRRTYLHEIVPRRLTLFRKLLLQYNPKIVIFFSLSYLDYWKILINEDLQKNGLIYQTRNVSPNFFVIPHPTAYGLSKNDWYSIYSSINGN